MKATFILLPLQTLHLRTQQARAKQAPPPTLKFLPKTTAIAPAVLCHKERKLSDQVERNLMEENMKEVRKMMSKTDKGN